MEKIKISKDGNKYDFFFPPIQLKYFEFFFENIFKTTHKCMARRLIRYIPKIVQVNGC